MSEHDDTLLDEGDFGDEEYDLGNDEEEALLADDYELERQNSYKGEEETDDVLDLGVTDALDDLDAEDENIEFSRGSTDKRSDNDFYKDGEHPEAQTSYYEQDENAEYASEREALPQLGRSSESNSVNVNNIGMGDLREKLQKNVHRSMYVGNGQGMEDDDCEEAKERRNRFQNERTMISPKMNNDIPDTLENVLTSEPSRMPFRGRGRGRGTRGSRGGRFNIQNSGNFNPRFGMARPGFENQPPACRPPLIETRPPCLLGVPSNVQNQQIMYQQANPQQPFQQPFGPNGPMQGPPPAQFAESRPQFNPGPQFQGPLGPPRPGPLMGSRPPEYGPRGPMQGPGYNCPSNHQPPYHSPMHPPFQNPVGIMQESRPMPGNQGPLLQGNPGGGSHHGNPNMLPPGNPNMLPPPGGNLPMPPPMQGFPRQQPTQGPPPMQNLPPNVPQMPSQPPFESRLPPPPPPFQEPREFEGRGGYDARAGYHPDQVPNSQFNNTMPPIPQQSVSNVSHMSLPPGHKILINPHFRGTVQPASDARLAWDSNQQVQPQAPHGGQFSQPHPPYQNQGPYNQPQQGPSQYQQNYQQNKSDDPYAYFSDVWQENRPQRPQNMSPSKHYSSDNNYSRESSYNDSKYKSEGQWDQRDNYQEDHRGSHQSYRERDLPLRTRNDHMQRSRTPPNVYRDSYEQKTPRPTNIAPRGINRPPQKRISESSDKGPREMSPKRSKPPNRNLQEVRRVDTVGEPVADKEEDSDPEMQEYRKKMEEQKRLREKLLREKENRRKMAAIEKQNEGARTDSSTAAANENTQQEVKSASTLMGLVNDSAVKTRPGVVAKGRIRPVNTQSTEATDRPSNVRIIRTIQTNDLSDTSGSKNNPGHTANQVIDTVQTRQVVQQPGLRRVVIQKPLLNSQKIATTIQKTVSNLQKNQGLQQKIPNTQVVQTQKVLQNQGNTLQKSAIVNQRMMAHKAPIGLQKTVINDSANVYSQKVAGAQQNPQRIVLQKSAVQAKKLPEIKTNTVKLENLAASTSEAQIRRMCQAIGTIESIRMGEGNATIVFKTQSAATVFHKKYQRKMLDLSLITVRLVPQSAPGNKAVTAVAKKS
ncbi:PREDICTED: RNA-binding protein 33-like [Wasmannia auropunctata]|uniref:RNA-binding protein 33-like n=1 Tax=Wasmannia auropunctata TaxID=64793 RepID=UPI0005F02F1C|nr:PREDICTED: RNA-binding protein 33-like [Wasmannia auropunctata]